MTHKDLENKESMTQEPRIAGLSQEELQQLQVLDDAILSIDEALQAIESNPKAISEVIVTKTLPSLEKLGKEYYQNVTKVFDSIITVLQEGSQIILAEVLYSLSLIQTSFGHIKNAISSAEKALNADPKNFKIYDALYSLLVANNHFEKAAEVFDKFSLKKVEGAFKDVADGLLEEFSQLGEIHRHYLQIKMIDPAKKAFEQAHAQIIEKGLISDRLKGIITGQAYRIDDASKGKTIRSKLSVQDKRISQLTRMLSTFGHRLNEVKDDVIELKIQAKEFSEHLELVGAGTLSKINELYKDIREDENVEKYRAVFHGAMLSWMLGMINASSNLLEKKIQHTAKDEAAVAAVKEFCSWLSKVTDGIPVIATITSVLDGAASQGMKYVKDKAWETRTKNFINKVLINLDGLKGVDELVKLLAVEMAHARKDVILDQVEVSGQKKSVSEKALGFLKAVQNRASDSLNNAKGSPLALFKDGTIPAQLAQKDVVECIVSLCKDQKVLEILSKALSENHSPEKVLAAVMMQGALELKDEVLEILISKLEDNTTTPAVAALETLTLDSAISNDLDSKEECDVVQNTAEITSPANNEAKQDFLSEIRMLGEANKVDADVVDA